MPKVQKSKQQKQSQSLAEPAAAATAASSAAPEEATQQPQQEIVQPDAAATAVAVEADSETPNALSVAEARKLRRKGKKQEKMKRKREEAAATATAAETAAAAPDASSAATAPTPNSDDSQPPAKKQKQQQGQPQRQQPKQQLQQPQKSAGAAAPGSGSYILMRSRQASKQDQSVNESEEALKQRRDVEDNAVFLVPDFDDDDGESSDAVAASSASDRKHMINIFNQLMELRATDAQKRELGELKQKQLLQSSVRFSSLLQHKAQRLMHLSEDSNTEEIAQKSSLKLKLLLAKILIFCDAERVRLLSPQSFREFSSFVAADAAAETDADSNDALVDPLPFVTAAQLWHLVSDLSIRTVETSSSEQQPATEVAAAVQQEQPQEQQPLTAAQKAVFMESMMASSLERTFQALIANSTERFIHSDMRKAQQVLDDIVQSSVRNLSPEEELLLFGRQKKMLISLKL